jgi:probable phosphoglycerate mutase
MYAFLLRHGETTWNRRQRCQGVSDVPLSATGRAQAAGLADALAAEPLAAVYASPLGRALETARAVAAPHRLAVTPVPDLRELDHGACEGLTPAELATRFAPVLTAWRTGPADVVLPGGESMRQVDRRASAALAALASRHGDDDTVAVVTHNLVILALLSRAHGWPLDRFRELRVDTAAISLVRVARDGALVLEAVNETAHLGYLPRAAPPPDSPPATPGPEPVLFGDLVAPFTYLALLGLARPGGPRLGWKGVAGPAAEGPRAARAARRFAAAAGVRLAEPPPLDNPGPVLCLLADAESTAALGTRLAVRLAALRFGEGLDLRDASLLVGAAAEAGVPAARAAQALDATTPVGRAAAGRVAADEAEAARLRLIGVPAAAAGPRVRTGGALLALARRLSRGGALAVALALAAGCSRTGLFAGLRPASPATASASELLAETPITRVAILGFTAAAGSTDDARYLADAVRERLAARADLSLTTDGDVAAARREAGDEPRAIAAALGAEAVLSGRIVRFRERDGRALAARGPASVEFVLTLRRTTDGALLWQGVYSQTQQALTENLAEAGTFIRGGGRWLTARELARLGVEDLVEQLEIGVRAGSSTRP